MAVCFIDSFLSSIFYFSRVAATLQLLIFFFIAVLALHPADYMPANYQNIPDFAIEWPTFFRMPVLMLMLITLLNDGKNVNIIVTLRFYLSVILFQTFNTKSP